jgi:hypothetical protein
MEHKTIFELKIKRKGFGLVTRTGSKQHLQHLTISIFPSISKSCLGPMLPSLIPTQRFEARLGSKDRKRSFRLEILILLLTPCGWLEFNILSICSV